MGGLRQRGTAWIACGLLLVGCMPQPTGPALTPSGQEVPNANRVLSGTVQGSKVTANTRVALVGYFANAAGQKLDAQGNSLTDDILISVPVKDGRYGLGLPVPPSGPSDAPMPSVRGRLAILVFDDANGNLRRDDGEAYVAVPETDTAISFMPFAGYSIQRNNISSTDPTYFDRVNLTFN
jgi:hypothetical protein